MMLLIQQIHCTLECNKLNQTLHILYIDINMFIHNSDLFNSDNDLPFNLYKKDIQTSHINSKKCFITELKL